MDHHHVHHHLFSAETINLLDFTGFVTILSFSFFSSLHCIFMCGPLVCSRLTEDKSMGKSGIWLYNLARGISYIAMGGLLGFFGSKINEWSSILGNITAFIIGVSLLVVALFELTQRKIFKKKFGISKFIPFTKFLNKIKKYPKKTQSMALGFITVLLPCMTLTPILSFAAASQSSLKGAITMSAFFLGTLPSMLSISILSQKFIQIKNSSQKLASGFLILAAIITIFRVFH